MNKARILWVDLEMTGLSPENDRILEVAAIATDWNFREIARYESAVKVDQDFLESRLVGKFWDENDFSRVSLTAQNKKARKNAAEVDAELVKFCEKYFAKNSDLSPTEQKQIIKKNRQIRLAELAPIYLAGNSIHQDQKFIEREFPRLQDLLNYRQLDVSSWKLVFENRGIIFAKPEDHRALADIEGSIRELKFYISHAENLTKNSRKTDENSAKNPDVKKTLHSENPDEFAKKSVENPTKNSRKNNVFLSDFLENKK